MPLSPEQQREILSFIEENKLDIALENDSDHLMVLKIDNQFALSKIISKIHELNKAIRPEDRILLQAKPGIPDKRSIKDSPVDIIVIVNFENYPSQPRLCRYGLYPPIVTSSNSSNSTEYLPEDYTP